MGDGSLKIDVAIEGRTIGGGQGIYGKVTVRRDGPVETISLSVVIPDQGDDAKNKAQLLTQAKDFAHQFSNFVETRMPVS